MVKRALSELGGTALTPLWDAAPAGRRDAAAMDENAIGLTGSWDSRISRRTLLRTGGAAAVLLYGGAVPSASAGPRFASDPFTLGVASGDPTPDGVVLWTRLAPDPLNGGGLGAESYRVRFEVAADPDFRASCTAAIRGRSPRRCTRSTPRSRACEPATRLLVPLRVQALRSARSGRLRTAPRFGKVPDRLRFAYVSCQNCTHGYFTAFEDLAQRGPRARRAPRRLHLRGPGAGRRAAHARAGGLADDARGLPDPARPVQDRHGAPGRARRVPVADDLGRPRVLEQLRRSRPRPRPAARDRRRSGAPPPTSPTGSTARCRARASRSGRTCRCTGARPGATSRSSTCSTRASTATDQASCPAAQRLPNGYCPDALDPARTILGEEQRDLADRRPRPARPPAGTCSPTRSRFAPTDTDAQRGPPRVRQRQLGRLRRRPPARARRHRRAPARQPDRHHRRRARPRRAQRAARLRELRRAARWRPSSSARSISSQDSEWPDVDDDLRRRRQQPAPAVPDQPARLRAASR